MYVYVMSGTWVIERTVNLIYNKVNSFLNYRIERSETETIVGCRAVLPQDVRTAIQILYHVEFDPGSG